MSGGRRPPGNRPGTGSMAAAGMPRFRADRLNCEMCMPTTTAARRAAAPVLMFAVLGLLLGAGTVQTRDGKSYEGDVAAADGAVVVRPAGGGAEARVPWDSVSRATFRAAPKSERPVGSADGRLPAGWEAKDVGEVHKPGTAACDEKGTFTLKASGWGAWGPDDSFHFAFRPLDGDGQVIARLAKVDDSRGKVVAGVMIRESTDPASPMAGATVYASGEVRLNHRPGDRFAEFKRGEDVSPRPWVRLTRSGDTFSAYASRDGKNWEFVRSTTVPMKSQALVGLVAWTTANTSLGEAQVDSVVVAPGPVGGTYVEGGTGLQQGVVLRDGTVLAGTIAAVDKTIDKSADPTAVKLSRPDGDRLIPRDQIARLLFNPPPPALLTEHRDPGVLLTNGDYVEGEMTTLTPKPATPPRTPQLYVGVTSLLFGARQFEASREVVAVVTGDVTPAPAAFEVQTADGSECRAKAVDVTKDGVVVDGKPMADVTDVRRL